MSSPSDVKQSGLRFKRNGRKLLHKNRHPYSSLITQINDWILAEKEKHKGRLHRQNEQTSQDNTTKQFSLPPGVSSFEDSDVFAGQGLDGADGFKALERLEKIIENSGLSLNHSNRSTSGEAEHWTSQTYRRRPSIFKSLRRSSTTLSRSREPQDIEALVPSTDVILDNSKLFAKSASKDHQLEASRETLQDEGSTESDWIEFKNEIVRLTHTLKLKNWRRVPLEQGSDISVERLSGALTNAVYVVKPPPILPDAHVSAGQDTSSRTSRKPSKLLLRIYGSQAEYLIDREEELQILRRLARKRIGPKLLGTFQNGRFEEYFEAHTLTSSDLRVAETSKQIAKRMRELHDGIELLKDEINGGPAVWKNWDKWIDRAEQAVLWLDSNVKSDVKHAGNSEINRRQTFDFLCGVEWNVFRSMVDRYRNWLEKVYDGSKGIQKRLVFAHNDTQYGNLLRIRPVEDSPLLLPTNEHKQIVVIDFEYASANVPGLEFANHFTEWCYNYHDEGKPYALRMNAYPSQEEQIRFIEAYVNHETTLPSQASTSPTSPAPSTLSRHSSSISSEFIAEYQKTPFLVAEADKRKNIEDLLIETKLWRAANSAQWVVWGILQANIPGFTTLSESPAEELSQGLQTVDQNQFSTLDANESSRRHSVDCQPSASLMASSPGLLDNTAENELGFDYLGYSRERALFFWRDMLELKMVTSQELPKSLLEKIKA